MIYFIIFLLVISVIINILSIKALLINLKKLEIYEKWFILYSNKVMDTYERLKEVDSKQWFEKDDDVGFVFTEILQIVEDLKGIIKYEEIPQKED